MARISKKSQDKFIPISGLSLCEAEEIIVEDESTQSGEWKDVAEFPYMKFAWPKLNPMQSGVLPYVSQDNNLLVCSKTASGKTTVIEMVIAYTISLGKKAIYLSPMKALSNEKLIDWGQIEHDFADKKIAILTGDQNKSAANLKKMADADINILTQEMLDNCTRTSSIDKFPWIYQCGALIIDEVHGIGDDGRGDKLEAAIMRFSELNPSCRIIGLSATIPNGQQLLNWFKTLNNKESVYYESKFRPTKLVKHYVRYKKNAGIGEQAAITDLVHNLLLKHPDESNLTFVGTKKCGQSICSDINVKGIPSEFYKADLPLEERLRLYNQFNERKFKHLVGTVALGVGINLSARNVFITSTTFGLNEKIPTNGLQQMAGRPGRPQYEDQGDVWIFLKPTHFKAEMERIEKGEKVMSQMHDPDIVAFHVLSEIMNKKVNNPADLVLWFNRSFACFQEGRPMDLLEAKSVFERLVRCGMILEDINNSGNYTITQTGIVTAMFYLKPEDVVGWKKNFDMLFKIIPDITKQKAKDWMFSLALSEIPSYLVANRTYVSRAEKDLAYDLFGFQLENGAHKIALCYYLLMNQDDYHDIGKSNKAIYYFKNQMDALKADSERIISAISLIDVRTRRWNQAKYWSEHRSRLLYGVKPELLELCSIEGIGGARSRKLYENGIRTLNDFIRNTGRVRDILGEKVSAEPIKWVEEKYSEDNIGW